MPSLLKSVVSRTLYPLILAVAVAAAWWVHSAGYETLWAITPIMILAGVLIFGLERVFPFSDKWRPSGRTLGLDLIHSFVSSAVCAPLVKGTLLAGIAWLAGLASAEWGGSLWPSSLPLWVQVPLAVVIADLGAYTAHRFMHASNLGWRLHAVHHSPTKLHVLASARSHPFNAIFNISMENGLLHRYAKTGDEVTPDAPAPP